MHSSPRFAYRCVVICGRWLEINFECACFNRTNSDTERIQAFIGALRAKITFIYRTTWMRGDIFVGCWIRCIEIVFIRCNKFSCTKFALCKTNATTNATRYINANYSIVAFVASAGRASLNAASVFALKTSMSKRESIVVRPTPKFYWRNLTTR